jgi:peptidoglycan DL-endopeptidase CwlO
MSMRFMVRGTTAVACAAFTATAVLSPAYAVVPATNVAASTFGQLAAAPMSPVIPSKDDIAKAKKSESATAAESTKIEAILGSANDRLQGSLAGTIAANNAYTNASVALDQRREEAATAKAKADAAAKEYQTAKAQLGQIAGTLYKNGGVNLSVQAFLGSSSADDTMYQASTLMVLSNERATTYDSASAASATSTALQAQSLAAQAAADKAAKTAEESKTAAQAATDALAAVVKENQSQRDVLIQQLASLHNTTAALEGARVDGLARQAQEAALAAQIKASAEVAAPAAPPATETPAQQPAQPAQPAPAQPVQPAQPTKAPVQPVRPPVQPPVQPVQPPKPPVVPAKPTPPPVVTPPPTQPSGSYIQVMVNYAIAQSGGAYQWGGTGNPGYDCSGLVMKAFAAAGVSVPRTGTDQFWAAPARVPLSQMRYGDLLVFDETSPGSGQFGHIAIFVGNGQVMQALAPGYPTGVSSISGMLQAGMTLYPYAARY